jgi:hypothetical protein
MKVWTGLDGLDGLDGLGFEKIKILLICLFTKKRSFTIS